MSLLGLYRGVCVRSDDPEGLQRIQAQVPQVFGDQVTDWAWPQTAPGSRLIPQPGETVWIQFEAGDPERPCWQGVWHTTGGAPGSFSVPLQLYVGVAAPAVLPTAPGLTMPTTTLQETAPGTVAVTAQNFATTGSATVGGPISAPSAAIAGNTSVGGTLGVTGATTLGATTVNGNTQINGTLTATTITGMITIDTTVGDISASAPGDAKLAGSRGQAADAGHRHSREAWGASTDITTSQPQDAVDAGATGKTCDAGHRHKRNVSESVFLGRTSTQGPTVAAGVPAGSGYSAVPSGPSLGITKLSGTTTDLIVEWGIGGYIHGSGTAGTAAINAYTAGTGTLFRIHLTGVATVSNGSYPFSWNLGDDHAFLWSAQQISGLAPGAYTVTIQVNTQDQKTGFDWYWNLGDGATLVVWEA